MDPLDAVTVRRGDALAQARRFFNRLEAQLRDDVAAWPPLAEPVEAFILAFLDGVDHIEAVILDMPAVLFLEPWGRPVIRAELSAWKKEWRSLAEDLSSGVAFTGGTPLDDSRSRPD